MCKNRNTVLAPITETGTLQLAENRIVLQVYGDNAAGTNGRELTAVVKNAFAVAAFPGDLAIAEVREFVEDQKKITIWTVPHHGSRNSADEQLYQQLCRKGVKQAIISAGADNHYGHPHQEVLGFFATAANCGVSYRSTRCALLTVREIDWGGERTLYKFPEKNFTIL